MVMRAWTLLTAEGLRWVDALALDQHVRSQVEVILAVMAGPRAAAGAG
jgi:hypothetical protein